MGFWPGRGCILEPQVPSPELGVTPESSTPSMDRYALTGKEAGPPHDIFQVTIATIHCKQKGQLGLDMPLMAHRASSTAPSLRV